MKKQEFLVALKSRKQTRIFKFPGRRQQLEFVSVIRKKWPKMEFAYTVEEAIK